MKSKTVKNRLVVLTAFLVIVVVALFIGGRILSKRYPDVIKKELQQRLPKGTFASYDSLNINLFRRSVTVRNLVVLAGDSRSSRKHHLRINEVDVSGVRLLKFFLFGEVTIGTVTLKKVALQIDNHLLNDSTVVNDDQQMSFSGLQINDLLIEDLNLVVKDDTLDGIKALATVHLQDVVIPKGRGKVWENMHFTLNESTAKDISIVRNSWMYSTSIKEIVFDEDGNVTIDSLKLTPKYSRNEFGRRGGRQVDRFECIIPVLKINELTQHPLADSIFDARSIHLYNPSLKAFRDKRLPFIKDHETPLPIKMLSELPIHFDIDTLRIHEANIRYEEFPHDGDSSGTVRFNDLRATLYSLNNGTDTEPEHIDLDVETKFMGAGLLKASFDFPLDSKKKYSAKGVLTDFDLKKLNPVVEPLAKLRIESGHMSALYFNFNYDNVASNGEVQLNYEDLKVLSLTEKESKTAVDKLKTFLLNTIIPNKKTEKTPEERRTGKIAFERDRKRSIFNYWWKSILSGIKECYGLEKKGGNQSK